MTLELVDIGEQELPDGETIPLPNVILGSLGNDTNKKTVSIYNFMYSMT